MKKLMFCIVMACGLGMGCSKQESIPVRNIEDLPAAKDFRERLCQAENGWLVRYFPQVDNYLNTNITENIKTNYNSLYPEILSRRLGVGGYNLFVKFQPDGTLKMLTDIAFRQSEADRTEMERKTYYAPEFNLEVTEANYEIKVAEGLNLILTTPTMLDQLKGFDVNVESRFSPVRVEEDKIVLRTANYLGEGSEWIELTPLDFPMEEWKERMQRRIDRKERFRKRSFATGNQKARRPCVLQILLTATGEVVYQSTMDFGYTLMDDRMTYHYGHTRENGERVARYDRLQYELFYKNEQPEKTVEGYDGSTYYTALGSGYIATEEGIFFLPGLKFNEEVVFQEFVEKGSREWEGVAGPYTARIKLN